MTLQFRITESDNTTIPVHVEPLFDCYHKWLGIPPAEQPPSHYRLLGLENFESDTDAVVNAADARMAHVKTFQNGRHALLSQRLLNEIAAARTCLLDPQAKTAYDQQILATLTPRKPPVRRRTPPPPVKPPVRITPAPKRAPAFPVIDSQPRSTTGRTRRAGQGSLGVAGWFVVATVTLLAMILGTSAIAAAYWFLLRPQDTPVADRPARPPVTHLVRSP